MPPQSGLMPQPWPAVSPDQTKRMSRRAAGGVQKAARDRLARELVVGEIDHDHPIEHALAGRQAGEIHLGGEVAVLERRRTAHQARIVEALGGRPLDHHARRPVGARPEDRAVAREIAALHAVRQARAHALAGDHRGRALLGRRAAHQARRRSGRRLRAPSGAAARAGSRACGRNRAMAVLPSRGCAPSRLGNRGDNRWSIA